MSEILDRLDRKLNLCLERAKALSAETSEMAVEARTENRKLRETTMISMLLLPLGAMAIGLTIIAVFLT